MKNFVLLAFFIFYGTAMFAQQKMRPISELINTQEPGWDLVSEWISTAKNAVEVLPADPKKGKDALYNTQVTSRSPLGAVVLMTGGILVDNGWIRILGSGSAKMTRSLPSWNKGKSYRDSIAEGVGYLLVADDAIGGFFIQNNGSLGDDRGKIYYLSPDNLEFEPMNITYAEFLLFCFNNDLDKFYKPYRWKGWENEVKNLSGDSTYNFFPPLFTKEGNDMKNVSRAIVPVQEQFIVTLSARKQLGLDN